MLSYVIDDFLKKIVSVKIDFNVVVLCEQSLLLVHVFPWINDISCSKV